MAATDRHAYRERWGSCQGRERHVEFEITGGTVSIMDYADDDLLVLNYEGNVRTNPTQSTA
jgi:hypothetical protein